MKISAINYSNLLAKQAQKLDFTQSKNNNSINTQKLELTSSLNYSDILFAGNRKEKRQILSRANAHERCALSPMSNIKFYVQKTSEDAPKIYSSIIEEENKAKDTIKEVYEIMDYGFKHNFETFETKDGNKVKFELEQKKTKTLPKIMLEFDKDNNLIRETKLDGISVNSITTFNSKTCDIIAVSHLKPANISKDVDMKGEAVFHASAVYNLEDKEKKSVSYSVNVSPFGTRSIEKGYTFNSKGNLEELLFLHKEEKDGSKESMIELKFNPFVVNGELSLDVAKKCVNIDPEGNLSADEVVEMHFTSQYPNKISKNLKQNTDGTRTSDHVYMFSGGKLLMVKSGEEKTKEEYKAQKIYKFSRRGLSEYMENCSMPILSQKSRDYTCEKKIEF